MLPLETRYVGLQAGCRLSCPSEFTSQNLSSATAESFNGTTANSNGTLTATVPSGATVHERAYARGVNGPIFTVATAITAARRGPHIGQ